MPLIRPFRGIHYDFRQHSDLSSRIAPPWYAIGPVEREELEAMDPWNAVRLEAPGAREGDGGVENRYGRSGRQLREWLAQGVLIRDRQPAIYALEQRFEGAPGEERIRRGFFARLELEQPSANVFVPHPPPGGEGILVTQSLAAETESSQGALHTLRSPSGARTWSQMAVPGLMGLGAGDPGEDRLQLYLATRINASPIFAIYPDDDGEVLGLLDPIFDSEPTAYGTLAGVEHRLWRVDSPGTLKRLEAAMANRRAYLVDGTHRYETAREYARLVDPALKGSVAAEARARASRLFSAAGRGAGASSAYSRAEARARASRLFLAAGRGAGASSARPASAHQGVLAYFCSMTDPGLQLQAIHRLVEGLPMALDRLLLLLDEHFEIQNLVEDVSRPAGLAWMRRRLAEVARGGGHAFGMVSGADGKARLLRLKEGVDLAGISALPKNSTLRSLDVVLLHGAVLQHTLGLTPGRDEGHLRYVPDAAELVRRALASPDQLGFVLHPASVWQIRAVAEAGELLPAFSTSFTPWVGAGWVFHSIDPHEAA